MARVLISAGDASGDVIAADFVRALRARRPALQMAGLAGPSMQAAGVEPLADSRALAVSGLVEILSDLGQIGSTWRTMVRALRTHPPDLVVLIDSGGFHLPFARAVRRRSRAPILYYVPPQVWAWRSGRLRRLAARSDRIAAVLPFEADFYASRGVTVEAVGHPILDREIAAPIPPNARSRARASLSMDPDGPTIGIFPGSRRNEVARHLPIQLAAVEELRRSRPDLAALEVVIGCAPSVEREVLEAAARREGAGTGMRVIEGGKTLFDAIDVALTKPGTITLELLLRERPMVVMGRAQAVTAAIVARSLRARWMALPNLIVGEEIVPERIQADARPDRIAAALAPLFPSADAGGQASPAARAQVESLRRARTLLGPPGASDRVAAIAEEMLGTDRA